MQAVAGSLMAISGLVGLTGGLRGAKAGAGIGPLFSVLSGQEEQRAAQEEGRLLGTQSDLAFTESLRSAAQKEREVKAFQEQQSLDFASSGITLQGSPLGVLEETRFRGAQEVKAIRDRGEALSGLLSAQGLQMLRRGSTAAFGGFAGALQQQFQNKMNSAAMKEQGIQAGLSGFGAGLSAFAAKGGRGYGAAPTFNAGRPWPNFTPLPPSGF
jgi:hypothetical protein